MSEYVFITLRERPELEDAAAEWFSGKWRVPKAAYLECMDGYLSGGTESGWYLCLCGESIVGGLGVIENDFHERPDLAPNICAVFTEPEHRGRGKAPCGECRSAASDRRAMKYIFCADHALRPCIIAPQMILYTHQI